MNRFHRWIAATLLAAFPCGTLHAAGAQTRHSVAAGHERSATARFLSSLPAHQGFAGRLDPLSETAFPGSIFYRSGVDHAPGTTLQSLTGETLTVLVDDIEQSWSTFASTWFNESREVRSYDPQARVTQRLRQIWGFMGWDNSLRDVYQYNGIGLLNKVSTQTWNGAYWLDNLEHVITLDAFGHVTEELIRLFNGSVWLNYGKHTNTYDSNGRMTEARFESWNGSAWVNQEEYLYTYSLEGYPQDVTRRLWGGSDWNNSLRDVYSYDGSGRLTGELNQFWASGSWKDDTRSTIGYDTAGMLSEIVQQKWVSSAWANDSRISLVYDESGHPVQILTDYWNGADWSIDDISYLTYDGMNLVEEFSQHWDGGDWVNVHISTYAWQSIITPDEITQKYPVRSKWNLVSVPLDVADHARSSLYPAAVGSAFAYDGGYVSATDLENRRGYWLKFDSAQTASMTGAARRSDTIAVSAGWNLIGSLSLPVAASAVASIPGGLVSSEFFGFNGAYYAAAAIEPGQGYWVKMADAGLLVMDASGFVTPSARLRRELPAETPPGPPADESAETGSPTGYSLLH